MQPLLTLSGPLHPRQVASTVSNRLLTILPPFTHPPHHTQAVYVAVPRRLHWLQLGTALPLPLKKCIDPC